MSKSKKKVSKKSSEDEQKVIPQEKKFEIQKIYVKDLSFETPNSPSIFVEKWDPNVNLELSTAGKKLSEYVHEVILSLTVTAKLGEKTAYLVEAQQAGIFTLKDFVDQELSHMLGSFCPNILYPYAREQISELVARGGFPQLVLAPMNFDALYNQHIKLQNQENINQPLH